ncbi:hypothetical protein WMW71_12895 [Flavobacterium buctense]|uniref:Uncharacterized protein n=1 Tax=Flavobacterium buctense TaxID=1648146 RepID=A0ABU9E3L4_9FLAO|nr:hypothetical protein [Flavobacterium buctense]
MNNSEKEMKEQESEMRKKLSYVFIPIAVLLAILFFYQNNSLDFQKKEYIKSKNFEFNGKVTKKIQDGNYYRASKYIILNTYRKIQIPNEVYYEIQIGDSAYKKKGKDSAYYCLKNGKILIEDRCKFIRENYLKLKTK